MKLASLKVCTDMAVRIVTVTAIAKMKMDGKLKEIEEPQGQPLVNVVTHSSIELCESLIEGK